MGRRDDPELTPDAGALAAEEMATRALLARFGEPAPAAPPSGLEARLLAGLPRGAPAPPPAHPWRLAAAWAGAAVAVLLLALGAWGVLINSLGPSRVAGDPADGVGQLVLVLTLAAKPLVNLLADAGLAASLAVVAFAMAAWLWWRLVRGTPLAPAAEVRR